MRILRYALGRKLYIPRLQLLGSPLSPLASQPRTSCIYVLDDQIIV